MLLYLVNYYFYIIDILIVLNAQNQMMNTNVWAALLIETYILASVYALMERLIMELIA